MMYFSHKFKLNAFPIVHSFHLRVRCCSLPSVQRKLRKHQFYAQRIGAMAAGNRMV